MMPHPGLLFVLSAGTLLCQVRLGIQGGEPFGDFLLPGTAANHFGFADYTSKPVGYTVGVTGEFGLPHRLSLEASALYQPFHYSFSGINVAVPTKFSANTTGNAWSFPILLKWHPVRRSPAYFSGGPVLRHLGGLSQRINSETFDFPPDRRTTSTSNPDDLRKRWYPGLALGGGWDLQFSKVRISPEIRYTRWTANIADDRDLLQFRRPLQFPPNRIELLVGITYRVF